MLQKTFIDEKKSGKKTNPKEIAARIRNLRNGQKKVFNNFDWLSVQQVKSCFCHLSVLQKRGNLNLIEHDEKEEVEMVEEALRRESLLSYVREEVEL